MKNLAAALPLLALSSLVAACSGGGGGGNNVEPCCSAQGQTDSPPAGPGFAFAGGGELFEGRFAQPIVFSGSSSCLSLGNPVLLMPDFDAVGKPVPVAADGSFTVDINERGIGREVAIRIYDELTDGSKVERAVNYLARPPVANPVATPIPVAPIYFDGRVFAEGTIEAAAYCELKRGAPGSGDDLQNLTLSDIRAVVTSSFASTFVSGGNRESVLAPIRQYRHAINGLVDETKNGGFQVREALRELRYDTDEEIDACLLGRADLESLSTCQAGPDAYRYWLLVRAADTFSMGTGLEDHLLAMAQDMTDAISRVDAANGHRMALLRDNYRLRYEVQAAAIRRGVMCFGDTIPGTCDDTVGPTVGTGAGSIGESLELLRGDIEAAQTPTQLSNAFFNRNLDIATTFGAQIGITGNNAFFDTTAMANAAQANILDDFSHAQIAAELATQLAATQVVIDTDYTAQIPSAADRVFLAQLVFMGNASAVQLVVDDTFTGGCFFAPQ